MDAFKDLTEPPILSIKTELTGLLVLVVGAGIKKFQEYIKSRLDKKRYSDDDRLTRKHIQIDDLAVETRLTLGADNVSVFRMHNGNKYAGNDCIKYLSMYVEKSGEGLAHRQEKSQRMLSDNYARSLQSIHKNKGIFVFYPETVEDWHLKQVMSNNNFGVSIGMLLYGSNSTWIGLVSINFRKLHLPSEEFNTDLLHKIKKEFEYRLGI